jgi:hypothetical protein
MTARPARIHKERRAGVTHRDQVSQDRSAGNPGPARRSSATVRPHTANTTATPDPRID